MQTPDAAPRYCPRCRKNARTVIGTYPEHQGGANCGPRVDICGKHAVPLTEGPVRHARDAARSSGYLVRCNVCGREKMSGASPLVNGWPKCCGDTMRLEDTQRFIADVDGQVREAFDLARISGARL